MLEEPPVNGPLTPILIAGLCYLIITIPLSRVSDLLERKFGGVRTKGATK